MKKLLLLMLAFVLVPFVLGVNCTESFSEFKPGDELHYICEDVNSTSCHSYVYLDNPQGGLINARPYTQMSSYGSINGYGVVNGEVLIDFSTNDLRPGYNYTFGVLCGSDQVEFNRSLEYKSLESAARVGVFLKDNTLYIAVFLLMGGLVLGLILFIINSVKYKGMGILDVIDNLFFRRRR